MTDDLLNGVSASSSPGGHPDNVKPSVPGLTIFILVVTDVLVLLTLLSVAVCLRSVFSPWYPIEIQLRVYGGAVVGILFLPLAYGLAGLYPSYGQTGVERLRKRISVTTACFVALILFDYLAQNGRWSRGILLIAGTLSLIAIPFFDGIVRRLLIECGRWGQGVAVFGPPTERSALVATLRENPELGWIPVAEADEPSDACSVNLAIIVQSADSLMPLKTFDTLPYRQIVIVPDLRGVQSLWISARDLGNRVGLEMRRNLLIPANQAIKRGIDLGAGTILLIASVPIIALFGLALVWRSPGPIFYSQIRAGQAGRPFRMWKLRTMVPNADQLLDTIVTEPGEAAEWNRTMKLRNDPRIVPVIGECMRRFSIDELPQFWNVLRGDMSLVGPRPLPDYHGKRLTGDVHDLRGRVRPGVTGLWQVSGRSNRSLDDQQLLDVYYVRNWSLWLDLHILARTAAVVISGEGAR